MKLSIKDRKQLWSAAAGMCSYHFNGESCERKLFMDNGAIDTNLGEECHIIGEKPTSARYQEGTVDKETYDNAILLCNLHHKIIDDNPGIYTVEVLRLMKIQHEQIIADRIVKQKIPPFILKDCQISVDIDTAKEDVIGLDVQKPTILSGVAVSVRANEARNVIGTRISGGFTVRMAQCPNCGRPVSMAYSGQTDIPIRECSYCHHQF